MNSYNPIDDAYRRHAEIRNTLKSDNLKPSNDYSRAAIILGYLIIVAFCIR